MRFVAVWFCILSVLLVLSVFFFCCWFHIKYLLLLTCPFICFQTGIIPPMAFVKSIAGEVRKVFGHSLRFITIPVPVFPLFTAPQYIHINECLSPLISPKTLAVGILPQQPWFPSRCGAFVFTLRIRADTGQTFRGCTGVPGLSCSIDYRNYPAIVLPVLQQGPQLLLHVIVGGLATLSP